ncbi:MAG: PfkB family carbohydrate kinase [Methyloligellaceae bacterium]
MIVCCGEALIDMIPRQLPDGSDVYYPIAGGAMFNTAIALGRLGERSGFYGGLSTVRFGQFLSSKLSEANVDFSSCQRSDRPTTLAFVEMNEGEASYTFYDEGSAGRKLAPENLPNFDKDVVAVHFGAISLIPEPCGLIPFSRPCPFIL